MDVAHDWHNEPPQPGLLVFGRQSTREFWVISSLVGIEKFGYGFGFTAFLMFLIYIARGPFKTAHYAFGTALMAFGMSIPGAISGLVQEAIGYEYFFIWVLVSALPIVIITPFIRIEADFGKKKDD